MTAFTKPRRGVHAVFVHCSASDRPEHDDVGVIRAWHLARGFSDVGYHYFIRKDGEIQPGRPLDREPAAQRGHNTGSIAICLHGLREAAFTPDQFDSLRDLCAAIDECYPLGLRYRGHCEVAAKACPVFDYRAVLGLNENGQLSGPGVTPYITTGTKIHHPRTLRIFDRGDAVRELQRALNRAGAYLMQDGIFGQNTRAAVRTFQSAYGLSVDGIAGPQTWAALVLILVRAA